MNLRDATDYIVGLDIGTGSVGWAVVDKDGDLYKFKGKNTWGSRLFDSANTAADTRMKRTLRRRYARRHKRIMTLRELILSDVMKVDPDFFCRISCVRHSFCFQHRLPLRYRNAMIVCHINLSLKVLCKKFRIMTASAQTAGHGNMNNLIITCP